MAIQKQRTLPPFAIQSSSVNQTPLGPLKWATHRQTDPTYSRVDRRSLIAIAVLPQPNEPSPLDLIGLGLDWTIRKAGRGQLPFVAAQAMPGRSLLCCARS